MEAYSTLGWFKDPVLNTFISNAPPDLAETIFHELGHQRVFAAGDTDFNEAFAQTVGQEGARRWLRAKGDQARLRAIPGRAPPGRAIRPPDPRHAQASWSSALRRRADRRRPTQSHQETPLACRPKNSAGRSSNCSTSLRGDYAQLKAQWGGSNDYDGWFARPLNNAQLNSVAAYYDLVPCFERLLAQNGGDLEKFYEAAAPWPRSPKKNATAGCNSEPNRGSPSPLTSLSRTKAPVIVPF